MKFEVDDTDESVEMAFKPMPTPKTDFKIEINDVPLNERVILEIVYKKPPITLYALCEEYLEYFNAKVPYSFFSDMVLFLKDLTSKDKITTVDVEYGTTICRLYFPAEAKVTTQTGEHR